MDRERERERESNKDSGQNCIMISFINILTIKLGKKDGRDLKCVGAQQNKCSFNYRSSMKEARQ